MKLSQLRQLIREEIQEALNEPKDPKDEKIKGIKNWVWTTCKEAGEDPKGYYEMIDNYFANKTDVTSKDFKNIWDEVVMELGIGDVGADYEDLYGTWGMIKKGEVPGPF
jgi:hypothetical protein